MFDDQSIKDVCLTPYVLLLVRQTADIFLHHCINQGVIGP